MPSSKLVAASKAAKAAKDAKAAMLTRSATLYRSENSAAAKLTTSSGIIRATDLTETRFMDTLRAVETRLDEILKTLDSLNRAEKVFLKKYCEYNIDNYVHVLMKMLDDEIATATRTKRPASCDTVNKRKRVETLLTIWFKFYERVQTRVKEVEGGRSKKIDV